MKKILRNLLLISLTTFSFFSCEKDESDNNSNDLAASQNATEETKIEVADLQSKIVIKGASKIEGSAPAPNSNLIFTVEDNSEAFQTNGLNIVTKGGENIDGAYIQFKDVDGNATNNYFEVPSEAFNNGSTGRKLLNNKHKRSSKIVSQDISFPTNTINVNFDGLPAGKFCYDICLFDTEGQIYRIVTKCITVEAWGGNSSIVGEWVYLRGELELSEEEDSIQCENGQTLQYPSINEGLTWTLILRENGIYEETYKGLDKVLNFSQSISDCKLTFNQEIEIDEKYSGNWAFNEEEGTLTTIDFKFEDFLDPNNNEEFPEGELYFEGVKAEVIKGELVLTDSELGGKVFFNRK